MRITHLRKVGGSIMLSVPPAFLEQLKLQPGAPVRIEIECGRLVIEPTPRLSYTLAQLLAEADYSHPLTDEEKSWIDGPSVGGELL